MKILLTGATGFLGSHLLRALLDEGYEMLLLKRSSSDCARIRERLKECKVFDVDCEPLEDIFDKECPQVVIHCAVEYGKNDKRAEKMLMGNLVFPFQLLEAAISGRCPYFINTDSFFTKQLPERFRQSLDLYAPEYTLTKHQFQEWGQLRAIEKKINFINLQLEHMYGEDDNPDKFLSFVMRSMREGVSHLDLTDGIQIRDFIHVDDVVQAYLVVLSKLHELTGYQSFEVGSGISCPLRKFLQQMKSEMRAETVLNFGAVPRTEKEIMYSTAKPQRLEKLGWAAHTPQPDGGGGKI